MKIDWLGMFILFGIIQAVLVILMVLRKKHYGMHRAFIWMLLALTLMQIESLFLRSGYFENFVYLSNTSRPLIFLLGPFLLIYVHHLRGERWSLTKTVAHLIPFIFYLVYSFNFFLQPRAVKYNTVVTEYHPNLQAISAVRPFEADPWDIQGFIVVELITVHLLIYSFMALFTVNRSKAYFKNNNFEHLYWLRYLSLLFIFGGLALFFSQGGVVNGYTFLKSPFPSYSADLVSTFSIYSFMIYLIIRPNTLIKTNKKYKTSSLPANYKKQKLSRLLKLIEEEHLYLEANFSLRTLSEKSGLTTHHISQILNEELQISFFQLTNRYRVEEAKKRLKDNAKHIKIEQLAYDLGYKSKSTFFKAFKSTTGLTPSEYRKD
ncbi:helix-turn-helix domain-containing protein [Winogradskyella sp.]|uniref:helix-turn-helix domain-containing protein n=1 Tax=Winogradskyella sp. TaxID=1883156 RepID=UPI003BAD563E